MSALSRLFKAILAQDAEEVASIFASTPELATSEMRIEGKMFGSPLHVACSMGHLPTSASGGGFARMPACDERVCLIAQLGSSWTRERT